MPFGTLRFKAFQGSRLRLHMNGDDPDVFRQRVQRHIQAIEELLQSRQETVTDGNDDFPPEPHHHAPDRDPESHEYDGVGAEVFADLQPVHVNLADWPPPNRAGQSRPSASVPPGRAWRGCPAWPSRASCSR